jgi:hypothetical protein
VRELDRGREIGLRLAELREARNDGIDLRTLARKLPIAVHVAGRVLGSEQRVELLQAGGKAIELGAKGELHRIVSRADDALGLGAAGVRHGAHDPAVPATDCRRGQRSYVSAGGSVQP